MLQPASAIEVVRWLECRNDAAEEVPAFGLVRVTGALSSGALTVAKPDTNDQFVLVNGPFSIAVGDFGVCTNDFPWYALYATGDGTPAAGQEWGASANEWVLRDARTGFRITGGPTAGRVQVTRQDQTTAGGGGGTVVVTDTTTSVTADTIKFPPGSFTVVNEGAGDARVDPDFGGTAEIQDVAGVEAAGTSALFPRADHVHALTTISWAITFTSGADFTIQSGSAWTFQSGSTVTYDSGSTLTLNGTVTGTATGLVIWKKYTRTHADFTAAALTETLTLETLPARHFIEAFIVKHSVQFSGGGLTIFDLDLRHDNATIISAHPVATAPSDTNLVSEFLERVRFASGITLQLVGTSNVNVADATAGSVDIWIKLSVLP